jgi:hypothetical protein
MLFFLLSIITVVAGFNLLVAKAVSDYEHGHTVRNDEWLRYETERSGGRPFGML